MKRLVLTFAILIGLAAPAWGLLYRGHSASFLPQVLRFYRRQGRGQKATQGIFPARPEGGPKRTLGSRVCEPGRSQEPPLADA